MRKKEGIVVQNKKQILVTKHNFLKQTKRPFHWICHSLKVFALKGNSCDRTSATEAGKPNWRQLGVVVSS